MNRWINGYLIGGLRGGDHHPFHGKRLNFSYGCYGCRDMTGMGLHEPLLGLPSMDFPRLNEHLEFLSMRVILFTTGQYHAACCEWPTQNRKAALNTSQLAAGYFISWSKKALFVPG